MEAKQSQTHMISIFPHNGESQQNILQVCNLATNVSSLDCNKEYKEVVLLYNSTRDLLSQPSNRIKFDSTDIGHRGSLESRVCNRIIKPNKVIIKDNPVQSDLTLKTNFHSVLSGSVVNCIEKLNCTEKREQSLKDLRPVCGQRAPNPPKGFPMEETKPLLPSEACFCARQDIVKLLYNDPPLIIKKIYHNDRIFNLVQDTDLPAGTKQRGLSFFSEIEQAGFNEIVTYGTVHGYGQVATAWCCKTVGLQCTIFLPRTYPRTNMTKLAIKLGASIVDVDPDNGYPTTSVLAVKARAYSVKEINRRLLEIGLDDPDFISHLSQGISRVSSHIKPKRIWVAGGSGVLSRALSKAFPESEICIVQVGRRIYPDVLAGVNYKLYISPEPFRRPAEVIPPYKSLRHYDAKVWRFARKYGDDGDYIWNVK